MARYLKCRYKFCETPSIPYSEKDNLSIETKVSDKGKKTNLYFHPECYEKHLKHQAFLDKDREKKDEFNEVVKKIYGVPENLQLPPSYWELIGDLREGTNRYERLWKKKYKQGIPFDVLKEAYLLAKGDIAWARLNKKFKTLEVELRYGLVIVLNKINDAYRKMKSREQQESMSKAMEEVQVEMMKEDREVVYKKQKDENDLSFLLGDD